MLKGLLAKLTGEPPGQPAAAASLGTSLTELLSPGPPFQGGDRNVPVPRWPEHGAAMITATPAALVETQSVLLDSIASYSPMLPSLFETLVRPVFKRYAAWVHLLPASENHHHYGPGGLLTHGIEVAMHAARIADGKTVGVELTPSERAKFEPRWKVAAMLAGLMHDLGKPLVDVGATDPERSMTWPSHAMPLYDWLSEQKLTHYRFYWRAGQRHERHKPMGTAVAREMLGPELLRWLSDEPTHDVIELMMLSIAQGKSTHNLMSQVVSTADSMSVEADLRRLAERTQGTGQGATRNIAALIMGEIRGAVDEGRLPINEPGRPLWWTSKGLFGLYPAIIDEIIPRLAAKQISGAPASRAEIARLLSETGFIEPALGTGADGHEARSETWDLELRINSGSGATPKLRALLFAKTDYVLGARPLPTPAEADSAPPFLTAADIEQFVDKVQVLPAADTTPQGESVASVASPAQPPATPTPTDQHHGAESSATPSEPCVEDRRNRGDLANDRSPEAQRRREAWKDAHQGENDFRSLCTRINKSGMEGAAIARVLQRIASGKLLWGHDLFETIDGLAVRYPSSFEKTGIPPADLLAQSAKQGWLALDQGSERKVADVDFPGGKRVKCVVFTGLIHRAWDALKLETPGVDKEGFKGQPIPAPPALPAPSAKVKADNPPSSKQDKKDNNATQDKQRQQSIPHVPAPVAQKKTASPAPQKTEPTLGRGMPTPWDLMTKHAPDLTAERKEWIRGAAYMRLCADFGAAGLPSIDATTLRERLVAFARKNAIDLALAGEALASAPNPLVISAVGEVVDLLSAADLSINPRYLVPDWAERKSKDT